MQVAEKADEIRSQISSAYNERLETEAEIEQSIFQTTEELHHLEKITVVADNPEEAQQSAGVLEDFIRMRANQQCADCGVDIEGMNGAWISVNLKVVVCVRCAGVHRSLGTSTSRVKSAVYDKWMPSAVTSLVQGGNAVGRELYLQRVPDDFVAPTEDSSDAEIGAHIRDKYVKLKWADPKVGHLAHLDRAFRYVPCHLSDMI